MQKLFFIIIHLSFIFFFTISLSHAKTIAPIKIQDNTVWSKKESPYIVNDDIIVDKNASLTIEPGVEIIFTFNKNSFSRFIVKGSLIAKGKENELISFKSSQIKAGSWGGIVFDSPDKTQSVIEYCRITDSRCAIACFQASPIIKNNILTNNEVAIVCENHSSPSIISNTITNNGIAEIYPSAVHCTLWSNPVIQKNIIENNYGHAIYCEVYSSPLISGNKIGSLLGANVVCLSFSNPKIINNDITQGTSEFGIILYHSSPQIFENQISNKRLYGITSVYSTPDISKNIFYKNYIGIYCIRSSPIISENDISHCDIALTLADFSHPQIKENYTSFNGIETKSLRNQINDTCISSDIQHNIKFLNTIEKKPLIIFRSFSEGSWDIGLLDGLTLTQTMLTKNSFHNGSAVWSPDGKSIAFTSYRDNNWDIFIMDSSGGNTRNLTNTPFIKEEAPPIWSPNGKKLAFERETPECQTVIMDLDTKQINKIDLKNINIEYPGLYPLVFIWIP